MAATRRGSQSKTAGRPGEEGQRHGAEQQQHHLDPGRGPEPGSRRQPRQRDRAAVPDGGEHQWPGRLPAEPAERGEAAAGRAQPGHHGIRDRRAGRTRRHAAGPAGQHEPDRQPVHRACPGLLGHRSGVAEQGTGLDHRRAVWADHRPVGRGEPDPPLDGPELSMTLTDTEIDKPRMSWRMPRVLMYHNFGDPPPGGDPENLFVPVDTFRAHLELLRDRGWRALTLGEFLAVLKGAPAPRQSYLITIDDGHESVLRTAAPILAEADVPSVLFVPPAVLGGPVTWNPA